MRLSTKKTILKSRIFHILSTVAVFCSASVFGQSLNNEQLLWERESFGKMSMSSEVVHQRSEFTKHFKNDNGKMTAIITAGPLNYLENGTWKTIYHSIIEQNNGFENVTNRHKTYYPQTSTGAITTILENGAVMKDMIGMRMYYQSNGTELNRKSIQSQPGQVDFDKLLYRNVYGNGIDLTVRQNTIGRKMDYIIREKSALGTIPNGADYLVFEETVELPAGWKAIINGKKIDLKDGNGKLVAFYDQPRYTDTDTHNHYEYESEDTPHEHHINEMVGDYQISQQGNLLTIKTLVPVSWLKGDLNFPVFIDPTITLYPDNAVRWTGHHVTTSTTDCVTSDCANYTSTNITGSVNGDFMMGRYNTYQAYNGWIKFNITDIPDDACISSAVLRYYATDLNSYDATCNVGTRVRHMATDPSTNDFTVGANNQARLADIRDGDIFNDLNTAVVSQGAGWRTVNLTANLNHIQSQLIPNWFALGLNVYSGAQNHLTCRYSITGYSTANRPQLIVDYDPPTDVENISICNNDLPYNWHGQTITAGGNGVATRIAQNASGCDVEITLNLTVNPETSATENITICQNELPYTWNGQTINAGGNGVATHITQDGNGCDVTTTLNLTVNPVTNTTDNITICQNELPYTWNGQTINTGGNGVATHVTQDGNGCDVTTTLNLTVNPVTNNTDNITICPSELPYTWNGQTINSGGNGVATHTTQDGNGCDVITTLNLTVTSVVNNTDNISICQSELPYTWNGQTITAGGNGVATHTVQDGNGCDITTTLNLTVNPETNNTDNISICQSELPYTWNGQTITAGGNGVATHVAQDANGCNVTTTLNLTVNAVINQTENISICPSELPYTWNGQTITAGGNGVATHATQDPNGCDVVTTLNLTVFAPSTVNFSVQADVCLPASLTITPTTVIAGGTCSWQINGAPVNGDCSGVNQIFNQSGCHDVTLNVIDANGCAASASQNDAFCIDESPVASFSLINQTNTGAQTDNTSSNATTYNWVLPNGTYSSAFEPSIPFENGPGTYPITLYAYSANGCVDSLMISVEVLTEITVPNVITANGDGANDFFILDGLVPNTKLLILNRWGNLIYTTDNYNNTWDGRDMNGRYVTEGVYTYVVTLPDGTKLHGFVHVVL